jgi:hypothetical protein
MRVAERSTMRTNAIALLLLGACSATQAPGTIVDGVLTFSPSADSLDKFEPSSPSVGLTEQVFPALVELDESSIGTGDCSMLVLQSGYTSGQWGWEFAAPAGSTFQHIMLSAPVTVDSRGNLDEAIAGLRSDNGVVNVALAGIAEGQASTPDELDANIRGMDHFEIIFDLAAAPYTTDLERIYPQALRQCPGDAPPFSLSATFE